MIYSDSSESESESENPCCPVRLSQPRLDPFPPSISIKPEAAVGGFPCRVSSTEYCLVGELLSRYGAEVGGAVTGTGTGREEMKGGRERELTTLNNETVSRPAAQ